MNDNNNKVDTNNTPLVGLGLFPTPTEGLGLDISVADEANYAEILEIQKKAFYSEALLYQNFNIQPLTQTLEEMQEECKEKVVLKAIVDGKIAGSIRANVFDGVCWLNKLVVLPEYQRRGIGEKLLCEIETYFLKTEKFILVTGAKSESNIRLYQKVGYQIIRKETFCDGVEMVVMKKENVIRH